MFGVKQLDTVHFWFGKQSAMFLIAWLWFSFINKLTMVSYAYCPASFDWTLWYGAHSAKTPLILFTSFKDVHVGCIRLSTPHTSSFNVIFFWLLHGSIIYNQPLVISREHIQVRFKNETMAILISLALLWAKPKVVCCKLHFLSDISWHVPRESWSFTDFSFWVI